MSNAILSTVNSGLRAGSDHGGIAACGEFFSQKNPFGKLRIQFRRWS
jgi:hypothetical protein